MTSDGTLPCRVFLTLTSSTTLVQNEKLVINWQYGCKTYADWIGLYLTDPSTTDNPPEFMLDMNKIDLNKHHKDPMKNYFVTNITLGNIHFPAGWDKRDDGIPKRTGPKCLPYYIASYRKNEIQVLDCLKIQPNWMLMQTDIGDAQLRSILLPGTRCSGCYYNYSASQSNTVQLFGVTQHFDIWQQLVMGIRYLDLSIAYREEMHGVDKFWIISDSLPVTKLENIMMDIRKFIIYSGEIVLLNFREFSFGPSTDKWYIRHWELVNYVGKELSDVTVLSSALNKYSYLLKINDIRKTGRGLVINYNDENIVRGQ